MLMADGLTDILDDLKEADDGESTSIGDVLSAFEDRSLGAILTMLGAIAALPVIGGIPGMSILTGTLVAMAVLQSLFASGGGLWAPERVKKLEVDNEKLDNAVESAKRVTRKVDAMLRPRLSFLVNRWAIAICALIMAVTFYPMAVVPWGVTVPALAVTMFGLSMIGRDGAFALVGYVLSLATAWIIWRYVL